MNMCKKYYDNGNLKQVCYYQNNKLHRLDGPVTVKYFENGNVKEEWYQ